MHRLFPIPAVVLAMCGALAPVVVSGADIEADAGKTYPLTKNRGPWMIMVATFHTTDADGTTDNGKSPDEAANELVLELRQLGMPAYVYEYQPKKERVVVVDEAGREERRKNLRRVRSVCVVAGNYNDINDKLAQDSLEWVKKLKPKCLQDGVVFQPTAGRPSPLSGAFLTINPLVSPEEVEQNRVDPLLVKLNHGERHSLLENPGEYTLVIARFYGKHVTVQAGKEQSLISKFLNNVTLDDAAESARELVTVLRGNYDKEATHFNNVDAYIWHDHHESIVTVGSFSSPNDPEAAKYKKRFGPKIKTFSNGTTNFQPEHLGVSGFGPDRNQSRLWLFEPNPQLMRVPHMK